MNARAPSPQRWVKPLRHRSVWLALWLCGVSGVIVACLLPGQDLPDWPVNDKLEHALAFAALAASGVQLFERGRALVAVGFGLLALGIGIEFAQALFTTTRAMEAADVLADGIGILAGLAVAFTPLRDALLHVAGREPLSGADQSG